MLKLAMLALIALLGIGFSSSARSDSTPPIKMVAIPQGSGHVYVNWEDYVPGSADTATVSVLRDGVVVATAPNPLPIPLDGNDTTLTGQPTGSHVFQVCENIQRTSLGWNDDPPALCSNTVTRTVT